MEYHNGVFWISDDIKHLSISEVARLHREVYGFDAYSEETVCRLLNTSLWLGVYADKRLVGFARAVTDKATFSYLCDIIIETKFRRQGLGSWLMECFLKHPDVAATFIGLGTQTADPFFEKFNFERTFTMRRTPEPEKKKLARAKKLPSDLEKTTTESKRFLPGMVSDTVALAKFTKGELQTRRFKIGDIDLCEPDYRQILSWAEQTHFSPEDVLRRLTLNLWSKCEWCDGATKIQNGKFTTLNWDPGLFPIKDFKISYPLEITDLTFIQIGGWDEDQFSAVLAKHGQGFEKSYLDENRIWDVNITSLPKLRRLICRCVGLTELKIENAPLLEYLECSCNSLNDLDLSQIPQLKELDCSDNCIQELKLNPSLEVLKCSENPMTELNLNDLPHLVELECHHFKCDNDSALGDLQSLDLRGVPNLERLDCHHNSLKSLDLSFVPKLKHLDCEWNLLTALDLSGVPLLESLNCVGHRKEHFRAFDPPWIIALYIQDLHRLEILRCDDRTRLVQRPDQHFFKICSTHTES